MRKISKMRLQKEVGEKWLERCHEKVLHQLSVIEGNFRLSDNFTDEIVSAPFVKYNGTSISPKQAKLIAEVLRQFDVIGIWKKSLYPGTIDPIVILELYGYEEDIEICLNMLHYIIDGFDRYFDNHVKELRRRRQLRRMQGIKIVAEVDARKRTHKNILNKIQMLLRLISSSPKINRTPYMYTPKQKMDNILKVVMAYEKIDYKVYRGQSEPTIKTMYARKGHIQLNRLI